MTRLILIRNAPSEDVALSARMDHRQAVVVAPVRLEDVLEAVVPAHRVVVVHHRRVAVRRAVLVRPVAAVVNRAVRVRRVVRALHQVAASPAAPVRRQAAVVLLPQVILLRMTMTVSHAIVMMRIVKMVMAIRGRLSPLKTVMSRIIAKVPARLAGLPTHPILLLSGRDAVLNRMLLPFLSVLTVRWNGRRVLMPFPVR